MSIALALNQVVKRFGDFVAVDGLSLEVGRGELVGFLGPNGAGKTTTLRMVMDILAPDAGAIEILGRPSASGVQDRVGYLPEERGLYRKMTVEATLRYLGRLKGLHGRRLGSRIDESLEQVGLAEWKQRRVEALSKGMQQKLQFIATLLHEPELVILDEPFSGLDPLNRELLRKLIVALRDAGATVIFSTHVMEQAEQLCDRLVLINRGRRLAYGTLAEIRAQFAARTAVLEGAGDFAVLAEHSAVEHADIRAGGATLELRDGADPSDLLRSAADRLRLTRFEVRQPTLQEIFVHLVDGDGAQLGAGAADGGAD